MPEPRYRRRKEARPHEIIEAAIAEFAARGYAATKVTQIARRAGISKGLLYLYFETKEDLFKAVIREVVTRRVDTLIEIVGTTELSAEDFLRGPMLDFMKRIPHSQVPIVIRLLISEGARYPEMLTYYYDNVVARGLAAIRDFVARGVERGEFRQSAISDLPQLFLAPMMLSVIWKILFSNRSLDTDALMETQIEMLLAWLKRPSE